MLTTIPAAFFESAIAINLKEQDAISDAIALGKKKELPATFDFPITFAGTQLFSISSKGRLKKGTKIKHFSADHKPPLTSAPSHPLLHFAWSNSHPEAFQELTCELANQALQSKDPIQTKRLELALILAWQELNSNN